jgi:ORF6N domain
MSIILKSYKLIERRIYLIRWQRVMLDSDLAHLYPVPTESLNLAVFRNLERFPADFMFQLKFGGPWRPALPALRFSPSMP